MRPTILTMRLTRTLPNTVPALSLSFALLASTGLTDPAISQELSVQVPEVSVQAVPPSLTVPTAEEARTEIQRTPGGVAVIPDTVFRNTPARTIKDIVEWTPGVIVQPRFGADARLSIRGSGLSRNYGNRGLNVFMDGVPVNTSDGLVDFFEIDPSAYRYVEVFKGSNALRLGGNSLGGATNLVTPTGRDVSPSSVRLDAGSFGYVRAQASTGGVSGPFDFFVTGAAQRQDGFREHSNGDDQRASGNIGYQFSPDAETRFYLNVNRIRQRIPGEVTQDQALRSPRSANQEWVRQDQARNIDSVRLANRTTLRFGATTVEFGAFGVNRHVMHPI
jgi:iron complex outermembrane receptor protein